MKTTDKSPYFNEEKENFIKNIPNIESKYGIKILLAFVRGSHMYGTSTEKSDVDITFVYQQPTKEILKGNYKEQISIGGNDVVGYEIQRYLNLLSQNNPNIIESLDIPEDCMMYKDPAMDEIFHTQWLTKQVEKTILGYADSQIKKATGLNKNMNNPQPKERKSILDFCYVILGGKSQPLVRYAKEMDIDLNKVGVVKNQNGKGLFAFYVDNRGEYNFRGIIKDNESTQIRLSEIPFEAVVKTDEPVIFYYNQDGFEVHCKQWKQYWEWEKERNQERFNMNQEAGQGVDLKNMMHLFRLLEMAQNISVGKGIQVRSENVELLKDIRKGKYSYQGLMENAESMFQQIKGVFKSANFLPETVDIEKVKELILKFRLNGL